MYHGELSEPQKLTKCCNAIAIWDECMEHEVDCYATTCEKCGTQLETDCKSSLFTMGENDD